MFKRRSRKSKYEIVYLQNEQQEDDAQKVVWPEHIRQQVYREYDCLNGETWRDKVFDLLFRLRWKEEWIVEAMNCSLKTVRRKKQQLRKKRGS